MMTMAVILMKEILSELHCIYCLCMCIPYSHYQKITTTTTKKNTKKKKKTTKKQQQPFVCVVCTFFHAFVCFTYTVLMQIALLHILCMLISLHIMYVTFCVQKAVHCSYHFICCTVYHHHFYHVLYPHAFLFVCVYTSLIASLLSCNPNYQSVTKEAEPTNYQNVTKVS